MSNTKTRKRPFKPKNYRQLPYHHIEKILTELAHFSKKMKKTLFYNSDKKNNDRYTSIQIQHAMIISIGMDKGK